MATPEEIKADQDAKAAEAKAVQEAKDAEAKAAKEAKEKADLAALTEWVAKAMIRSHQGDNPVPIDDVDPASALTAAREFVAAFKAMGSYKPKDAAKDAAPKGTPPVGPIEPLPPFANLFVPPPAPAQQ